MKAAGIFISSIVIVDTFLVSYAVGFNSRHVLVIDPKLPPVKVEKPVQPSVTPAKADTKDKPKADGAKAADSSASKGNGDTGNGGKTSAPADSSKAKKHQAGKSAHHK
jgi:hypothetical protein